MKTWLLFITLIHTSIPFAAEADHYSYKDPSSGEVHEVRLKDSKSLLTKNAGELLRGKLQELNQKGSCQNMEEKEFYKELQDIFANHSKGKLIKDILYTDQYPTIKISLEDSIYGSWSIFNGFLLGRKKAATSPLALAPLIRVGSVIVGVDKLEHLFGMGQQYFVRHYLKGHGLRRVLKRGIFFEKTILGGNILATGVFSYADLASNFQGMRFWNHMLQLRDDVLGPEHNIGPYVECRGDQWQQVKPIDFGEYMDLASDESINCSKFASKKGLEKYTSYLNERQTQCPRSPQAFENLLDKYNIPTKGDSKARPLSHWILNEDGNEKVSYFFEF